MITVTIVRHGESIDNLKPLWAGWADGALSVHGMNQAKALGQSLKTTKIDAIYTSDLKRALWTAQQIEHHAPQPKPPLTISKILREQHWGQAELKPWTKEGGFVRQPGRTFKFPDGESLEDVRTRANQAVADFIEPHLEKHRGEPASSFHVVVVAHGIFNAEFIGALLARQKNFSPLEWGYRGMTNTGWTRAEVGYAIEASKAPESQMTTNPSGPQSPSSTPSDPPPDLPVKQNLPPLSVRIISTDVTTHLEGVHRQKGGIGSQAFDENQKDLRAFFSGAGVTNEK